MPNRFAKIGIDMHQMPTNAEIKLLLPFNLNVNNHFCVWRIWIKFFCGEHSTPKIKHNISIVAMAWTWIFERFSVVILTLFGFLLLVPMTPIPWQTHAKWPPRLRDHLYYNYRDRLLSRPNHKPHLLAARLSKIFKRFWGQSIGLNKT